MFNVFYAVDKSHYTLSFYQYFVLSKLFETLVFSSNSCTCSYFIDKRFYCQGTIIKDSFRGGDRCGIYFAML